MLQTSSAVRALTALGPRVLRSPLSPTGKRTGLMCGRFTNRLTWREIVALYRLSIPGGPERNLPARYNICPTDAIDAVIERDAIR